jgi:S1-C subfamily serine protease
MIVVGRDAALDIAVLKVEVAGVAVAEIGDSTAVRVGHLVLALPPRERGEVGLAGGGGAAPGRASAGAGGAETCP